MSRTRTVIRLLLVLTIVWLCYGIWARRQPDYYWKKAQFALQQGDREAAVLYLQNMIRRAPDSARAHLELAKTLRGAAAAQAHSYTANPQALAHLAVAAQLQPDDLDTQQQLLAIYLKLGQMQNAAEVAIRIFETVPDNADVLFVMAWKAVQDQDTAQADRLLTLLGNLESRHVFQELRLRLQNHLRAERHADAQQTLDDATALASQMSAAQFGLLSATDLRVMPKLLLHAVRCSEDFDRAYKRAAECLDAFETLLEAKVVETGQLADEATAVQVAVHGKFGEAVAEEANGTRWRRFLVRTDTLRSAALSAGDASPLAYFHSASFAAAASRDAEALETIKMGLSAATERLEQPQSQTVSLDLHRLAALILIRLDRAGEARGHIEEMLAHRESAGWGHLFSGDIARNEGRLERALRHYLEARSALGDLLRVRSALADTYVSLQRWADALPFLASLHVSADRLTAIDRSWAGRHLDPVKVHFNELRVNLALNRWLEAQPHLEALRDSEMEAPMWALVVEYLQTHGQVAQATQLLAEVRDRLPRNTQLLSLEVAALERSGDVEGARLLMERFVTADEDDLGAQLLLCNWRVNHRQVDQALRQLDELKRSITTRREQLLVAIHEGRALLAAGKPKQALAVLEPLRGDPTTAAASAVLAAQAAVAEADLEMAAQFLSAAGNHPQASPLAILQGEIAAQQGSYDQATTTFASSLGITAIHDAVGPWLLQSLIMMANQGNADEVAAKIAELLEEHGDDLHLYLAQAEMELRQGHLDATMQALDRVEQLEPQSPLGQYLKALVWQKHNRADLAVTEIERALRVRPEHLPSLVLAAEANLTGGRTRAALRYCRAALKQNRRLWTVSIIEAECLARLDRHGEAAALLEAITKTHPETVDGFIRLGRIYEQVAQPSEALDVYRRGRQQISTPSNTALACAEVALLCKLDRVLEAEELAQDALGSSPDAERCLQFGAAFLSANQLNTSQRWGNMAMELADETQKAAIHSLLGKVAYLQDQIAADPRLVTQARNHFTAALKGRPKDVVAANNLAWLLATRCDQPEEAIAVCEEVLRRTAITHLPSSFIDTVVVIYRQIDRLRDAELLLQEAMKYRSAEPMLLFQLGMTFAEQQQNEAAARTLKRALQLGLPEGRSQEVQQLLASMAAHGAQTP